MPAETEPFVDYQVTTIHEGEYVTSRLRPTRRIPAPIVGSGVLTLLRKVFSPRIRPGSSLA